MVGFNLSSHSPAALADSLLPQRFRGEFAVRLGAGAAQDAWWLLFTLISYFAAYQRAKSVVIGLATIEHSLTFEFVATLAARSDLFGGLAQDYLERLPQDQTEAKARFDTHASIARECIRRFSELRAA